MRDGSVQEALYWFGRTHDVEVLGLGGAVWRLVRLPTSGGPDVQDAKVMATLDFCRAVSNRLLATAKNAKTDDLKEFHDQQRQERGRDG